MNRDIFFRGDLDKGMLLAEIGASHSPLIPKRDGWRTTVCDYADADTLRKHYHDQQYNLIEDVDVVWSKGQMHESFDQSLLGAYDCIIASHVFEHIPDGVRFLRSCQNILASDGTLKLALPDKRCCFDFFGQLSTTGDLLSAYDRNIGVHDKTTSFKHAAYSVKSNGSLGWLIDAKLSNFEFVHDLDLALGVFNRATDGTTGPYYDFHTWRFTPSSFHLIILELKYLNFIDLIVSELHVTETHEFYVVLKKSNSKFDSIELLQAERMRLLKSIVKELSMQYIMIE